MGTLDFQVSFKQLVNGLRIAILNLKGSIDGSTVKIFEAKAMDLYNDGIKYLILNFEEIGYMNSTGLGILVKILDKYQDTDGDVKLLKVPRKIEDLFDMLGISSIVTSYSTLKEALYSLPSPVVETEPDENFALKSSELPSELDMNLDTNLTGWDNDNPEALFDSGVDLKWSDNSSSDQKDNHENNGNNIDYTETLNSNAFGIDLSNFNNTNTEAPQQNYDIFNIDVNEINKPNELDVLNDFLFSGQPQENNSIENNESSNSQNADDLLFSNMPEELPTQSQQSSDLSDLTFGNEPAQQEQAPDLTDLTFGNEAVQPEQSSDLDDLVFGNEPAQTEQASDLDNLVFGSEPAQQEQAPDLTDLTFGSEPVQQEQAPELTDLAFGNEPVQQEQAPELTDLAFGNEPVQQEQAPELTDLAFGSEPVQQEQAPELTDLAFGSESAEQEQAPELTDLAFGSEPVQQEQAPEVESQEAVNENDASLEESSELKIDTTTESSTTSEETPESTQENIAETENKEETPESTQENIAETENKEETPESTQENIDNITMNTEEENESEKVLQDAFELTEDKTIPTPVNKPIVAVNNEANIVEKSQEINSLLIDNKQEQKDNDIPDEVLDAFRDSEEKVEKVHVSLPKSNKTIDVRYYHKMNIQKVYSLDVDVNYNKDIMIAPCIPNCMVSPSYAFVKSQQEKQTIRFKVMPIAQGNIQGTIDVFENNQKTMSTELKSKITCAFMSFFFFLCAFVTFAMYIASSNIYIQRAMDYILDKINCPKYSEMIQKIIDCCSNYCALDMASATLLLFSVIFLGLSILIKVTSMITEKLSFK